MSVHPPDLPASTSSLDQLATDLDDLTRRSARPHLVGVSPAREELDVHVRELPGHPVDDLLGFTAPADWIAVGIAATGRVAAMGTAPPEASHRDATPHPTGTPARIVHLAARHGETVTRCHIGGSTPRSFDHEPTGLLVDVCRRALGLATEPPPGDTGELWTRWWIDRVVQRCVAAAAPSRWEEIASLHPAVAIVAGHRPELAGAAHAELAPLAAAFTRQVSWTLLRTEAARAELATSLGLQVRQVHWMDDGIFSRWALARFPELDDLTATAAELLPSPLADRLRDVARHAA